MYTICFLLLIVVTKDCVSQDEEGPYRGKFIGKLNSYHHQVSGDVYAVDDWTLLLVNFNYDGTGDDTFFWAGDSGRPGPQGFIVPNEHGRTNILERYYDAEVRLTLPEGKRISRVKWLAVYDIGSQNAFGDVYVPDEFEAPAVRSVGPLAGSNAVSSKPVQFLDATTLLIPEFRYDGSGEEVYFWTGVGPQPSSRGMKIPDEYGYLEPLRAYAGEDVRLELPGGTTVFDVKWLSVWDAGPRASLGAVLVPDALNVPPAYTKLHDYKSSLPHCKQLHRDYQVSWEVFGSQITFELAAQMEDDEYVSFGVSGSTTNSSMLGADVAVAYFDSALQRGLATDYNITALAPCVQVLGAWRGVCRDEQLGGLDSNQVFNARRSNGLTIISYRRSLAPSEPMDREWAVSAPTYVVWALGRLDHERAPAFHRLYPRQDLRLHLGDNDHASDCVPFTVGTRAAPPVWEVAELFDPALRVFQFRLGPAGGRRGLAGRQGHGAAPPLAWYVNGQLAPDLQLRRGLTYSFKVWGGNDPHSATEYHPLIVTAEPVGGLERLSEAAQRAARVLAGVHYTRRGRLAPTAAGPLCQARHAAGADRRRDDDYATFRAYNRSLSWSCAAGPPADLVVAPNTTWPDIVYYHSFTHSGMGGRIFVVDRHKRNIARTRAASSSPRAPRLPAALAVALALLAFAAL
ncbi:cytochrome and DOMON domain-containing protein knickkopf [Anticarsia gemmatalis]|uniref:cytochrome and DOMON domain-containing protein knickkopf n=1 Tax=Anticarsia gemmatalis TaxID=129554 RepID=UPI003F7602E7